MFNTDDAKKFFKKIAAKCFIDFGFCFDDVRKEIEINKYPLRPDFRKYSKAICEIVRNAYRTI